MKTKNDFLDSLFGYSKIGITKKNKTKSKKYLKMQKQSRKINRKK